MVVLVHHSLFISHKHPPPLDLPVISAFRSLLNTSKFPKLRELSSVFSFSHVSVTPIAPAFLKAWCWLIREPSSSVLLLIDWAFVINRAGNGSLRWLLCLLRFPPRLPLCRRLRSFGRFGAKLLTVSTHLWSLKFSKACLEYWIGAVISPCPPNHFLFELLKL